MIQCDYLIIGAGIIGLSIAKSIKQKLPDASIIIIEKEDHVAQHASGRNSGVLHAGFYYTADSLKAKFTKEGNALLTQYCLDNKLAINQCGKVIVASNQKELEGLEELKRRGERNAVELHWLSQEELHQKYPDIKTHQKALYSPSTSTVNPKEVCEAIYKDLLASNVQVKLNTSYIKRVNSTTVQTSNEIIQYSKVINCAGLYADKIAQDFSCAKNFTIIPFKGIY
ncbi:MAG: FAD-dependent oxidoreductase, partial [Campylobacterota bacterium]|nr:FAD-dependent oxidoreductase [Campylobacterota bacterium]